MIRGGLVKIGHEVFLIEKYWFRRGFQFFYFGGEIDM
jgi:hypothetical protein